MISTNIVALAFSVWHLLHPGSEFSGDAPVIAGAIATAVEREPDPTPELDTVLLAYYAMAKSNLYLGPPSDGTCGAWRLSCADVDGKDLAEQASIWLRVVHARSLTAIDSRPQAFRSMARCLEIMRAIRQSAPTQYGLWS